jgi:hypothetical protein
MRQTETQTVLDRFDGGSKRVAQAEANRPRGEGDDGEGDDGAGCGFILMVIAFVLLGLLFWRMA